ncbi:hypothetical protein [Actinocorallia populi]|uniref:hypothetical protein n=1 Tax=Actinocorallia populi TaxID=2079200 RepID=UPI000D088A7F|nr:hypothetical protein [Actinocorallia populi]
MRLFWPGIRHHYLIYDVKSLGRSGTEHDMRTVMSAILKDAKGELGEEGLRRCVHDMLSPEVLVHPSVELPPYVGYGPVLILCCI